MTLKLDTFSEAPYPPTTFSLSQINCVSVPPDKPRVGSGGGGEGGGGHLHLLIIIDLSLPIAHWPSAFAFVSTHTHKHTQIDSHLRTPKQTHRGTN